MQAYSQATEEISEPWEFHMLLAMSHEYRQGVKIGADGLGIPPYEATH